MRLSLDLSGLVPLRRPQCVFTVIGRDETGEMTGLGKSNPRDLLLRDFGEIIGTMFQPTVTSTLAATVATVAGTFGAFIDIYTPAGQNNNINWLTVNGTCGALVAVGTSTAAPQRNDVALGGQVGTWTITTGGQYNTGPAQVVVSGAVPISVSLAVSEAAIAGLWSSTGGTNDRYMIAHDLVVPSVNVPAGGNATVNWALQI